jgi:pyruvate dehydrogenase E1 component
METLTHKKTTDWLEALDSVVKHVGIERAQFLLDRLAEQSRRHGIGVTRMLSTPYTNTIAQKTGASKPPCGA